MNENEDYFEKSSVNEEVGLPSHPLKDFMVNEPKVGIEAFSHERIVTIDYHGPQKLERFTEAMIDAIQPQYDMQRGFVRVHVGDYPADRMQSIPWEKHGYYTEHSYHEDLNDLMNEQAFLFNKMNTPGEDRNRLRAEFARVSKAINVLGGVNERREARKPPLSYSPELDAITICPAEFSALSLNETSHERKVWDYFTALFRSALAVHEFGDMPFYQTIRLNFQKIAGLRNTLGEIFDERGSPLRQEVLLNELITEYPRIKELGTSDLKTVEETIVLDLQMKNWRLMEKLEALHITPYIDLVARQYAGGSVWARQRTLCPDITVRDEELMKRALSKIAYDRGRLGTYAMFQNAKDIVQSAYLLHRDLLSLT